MSIEAFEIYIRNAHKANEISKQKVPYINTEISGNPNARAAMKSIQRYYYDAGALSLFIETNIILDRGVYYYDAYLRQGYTTGNNIYPYLEPVNTTHRFSSDNRTCNVSFSVSAILLME